MNSEILLKLELIVVLYEEDSIYYSYCPALDLYGYGDTEQEAKESFEIVLSEFLDYTIEKNTLETILKKLGWKIKGTSHKKITPPDFVESIKKDRELQKIIRKPVSTYKHNFSFA